ncbi:hypothetical protein CTH30272_02094 [Allocatenococcus thiocycli]|nr:hypothetical protein CTH30272_02094 [Catenococcus thiocycli]
MVANMKDWFFNAFSMTDIIYFISLYLIVDFWIRWVFAGKNDKRLQKHEERIDKLVDEINYLKGEKSTLELKVARLENNQND